MLETTAVLLVLGFVASFVAEENRVVPHDEKGRIARSFLLGPFGLQRDDYTKLGWRMVLVQRSVVVVGPILLFAWFLS